MWMFSNISLEIAFLSIKEQNAHGHNYMHTYTHTIYNRNAYTGGIS